MDRPQPTEAYDGRSSHAVGTVRNHLQFLEREPMLTGILQVVKLPPQCTFWRFLASLHLVVAGPLLEVGRRMRQRVWEAAHVGLKEVTLDTDTTVQTVYGRQRGARKGYNPQHRGKKSLQPILTFLAETREYVGGELRKGDRPTGKQIAAHLEGVFAALPESVERVYARADSGFLLRGGRGGVCAARMPVCVVRAEDPALGGAVANDAVDRVAAHRRGRSVRVSLPAGRLGQSLPVCGLALFEEGQAAAGEPARAIPSCSIRRTTPIACS